MVYSVHLTVVKHGIEFIPVLITGLIKHGIWCLPMTIEKFLRFMSPAMYCTLWREIPDADKRFRFFLDSSRIVTALTVADLKEQRTNGHGMGGRID
jgi:hypothetical protein